MIGLLKERTNDEISRRDLMPIQGEQTVRNSMERSNAEPNGRESEHNFGRVRSFPEHGVLR